MKTQGVGQSSGFPPEHTLVTAQLRDIELHVIINAQRRIGMDFL